MRREKNERLRLYYLSLRLFSRLDCNPFLSLFSRCLATAIPTGMFLLDESSNDETESGDVTVSLLSLFFDEVFDDSLEAGLVNNESLGLA